MEQDLSHILIASDIDGTFAGKRGKMVEANYEAVQRFAQMGGVFTFATGRAPVHLGEPILRAAPYVGCHVVTANGMCLYDLQSRRVVEEHFLNSDRMVEATVRLLAQYPDLGVRLAAQEGIVVNDLDNPYLRAESGAAFDGRVVMPTDDWRGLHVYKFVLRADVQTLTQVKQFLLDEYAECFAPNLSASSLLDIQAHGRSKATMLCELRDRLSGQRGKQMLLIAVGDEENDIEMLRAADVAVCPANAREAVKAICKYCLCHHNYGVIADLLQVLLQDPMERFVQGACTE